MRTLLGCLAGMAILVAIGVSLHAQGEDDLGRKQDVLNSEYSLARTPNYYFVLDVSGKTLDLRARGVTMKSWPLRSMRFWGEPAFQGNVELKKKSTLKAPQRIVIRPDDEQEETETAEDSAPAEYDVEALELKDMPESFRLEFDNGFYVYIRSSSSMADGFLGKLWNAWKWHVGLPIWNLINTGEGKAKAWLELAFENKSDAQAIYWHFFEGIQGIIL